jgi:hypothetical protein
MELSQVCRLCLEKKINEETVLVDIFSTVVNLPGKTQLCEKINLLANLKVQQKFISIQSTYII